MRDNSQLSSSSFLGNASSGAELSNESKFEPIVEEKNNNNNSNSNLSNSNPNSNANAINTGFEV